MNSTISKERKINGLIVFVKNAISGQVKTRLAKKIGQGEALSVYLLIQKHLAKMLSKAPFEVYIFYSSFIPNPSEIWPTSIFRHRIQEGGDLGERMEKAIQEVLLLHERVVIIGSDIAGLTLAILESGFQELEHADVVIGPAKDGGYYLIGMKNNHPQVFQNMQWSQPKVLEQTTERICSSNLTFQLLPTLSDVDTYEDWVANRHLFS